MTIDSIISGFQRKKKLYTGKKLSLAPRRLSLDEVTPYYLDINMVFDNEAITNIAISGPYGCGKSSFIKSIDQLDGASEHSFKCISVPSFVKTNAKNYKKADSLKRKLEKGILDQITIGSSYSNSSHAGISSVCQSGILRSLFVASFTVVYGVLLLSIFNLNTYSSTNDFLFAAVVYKILFPRDFALFQSSKGLLHSLMNSSAYLDVNYHSAFREAWTNVLYSEEPISIVSYAIGNALDDGLLEDHSSAFYSKNGNAMRNNKRFPAFLALLRSHRLSFQMVRCVSRSHGDSLSWNDWCYLKLIETENIPRQQFKPHSCGALLARISPERLTLPAYRNIDLLYFMFRNESKFEKKFDSFLMGLIKDSDIDFVIWYLTSVGERAEFTDSEISVFATLSRAFLNNDDIEDCDKTELVFVLFHCANSVRMDSLILINIVNNYCKAHPKLLDDLPLIYDIGLAFANMNKEGLKFDAPAEDCCTPEVLRLALVNDLIPISFKLICRAADFELTADKAPFALSLVFDMAEETLLNWIDRKINTVIDMYIDAFRLLVPDEPVYVQLTKTQLQHIMSLQNLSPRLRKTLSEVVDCTV